MTIHPILLTLATLAVAIAGAVFQVAVPANFGDLQGLPQQIES